jgi:thioesterase domain-containing protein
MAAAYIEDIRAVQAQGPYRLAGASIGGLVVFEMAQQLRHRGESVDVLILLDPSQAGVPVSPDRLVRIRRITRRALDRVAEAWRKTGRRVPRRLRLARFLEVSLGAASRYQPKPYPGRVLLLVAAEGRTDVQREFWRGIVTGPLEIQAIPGDHFSMFRPPHLAVLARHVRAALAAP